LEMAEAAIEQAHNENRRVYSLGKVIHNNEICNYLSNAGMQVIGEAQGHEPGLVVLRAHGIPDAVRSSFIDAGYELVDATCPVVRFNLANIATYAKTHSIVIVGHSGHPETAAMQGVQIDGEICPTTLITSLDEVIPPSEPSSVAVFVQTTFDQGLWNMIKEKIQGWTALGSEVLFVNEICPSSINRRNAALELAGQCDAVLVIGGRESANTRALCKLILENGTKAWHIENETEITEDMRNCDILGITAGASTPPTAIQRVIDALQQE